MVVVFVEGLVVVVVGGGNDASCSVGADLRVDVVDLVVVTVVDLESASPPFLSPPLVLLPSLPFFSSDLD